MPETAPPAPFKGMLNSPPRTKLLAMAAMSSSRAASQCSVETALDSSVVHSVLSMTDVDCTLETTTITETASAQKPVSSSSSVHTSSADASPAPSSAGSEPLLYLRLIVADIVDDLADRCKDVRCFESSSTSLDAAAVPWKVLLRDHWYDAPIVGGDVVHIVFVDERTYMDDTYKGICHCSAAPITVSDRCNLLIHFPDILVSPSKIVDSLSCNRRGLLSSRSSSLGKPSAAASLGSLKHGVIEKVIEESWRKLHDVTSAAPGRQRSSASKSEELVDPAFLAKLIGDEINKCRFDLLAAGVDTARAQAELQGIVKGVVLWSRRAFFDLPASANEEVAESFCLKDVAGIEESFCSPIIGLKGIIDLVATGRSKTCQSSLKTDTRLPMLFPIEIKTGLKKAFTSNAHKAQVILYVLAMRLRQLSHVAASIQPLIPPSCGILLYISADVIEFSVIKPSWTDVRQLVIARNLVAHYIKLSRDPIMRALPPLLMNANECSRCFSASECMLSHISVERGSGTSSGVPALLAHLLRGLGETEYAFFEKWDALVDLEANASAVSSHRMWTQSGALRSRRGDKCVGGLAVESVEPCDDGSVVLQLLGNLPHEAAGLVIGDRVQIGAEPVLTPIAATGRSDMEDMFRETKWKLNTTEPCIAVGSIAGLHDSGRVSVRISNFSKRAERAVQACRSGSLVLRLDKDEGSVGISALRANLFRVFVSAHDPVEYRSSLESKSEALALPIDGGCVRLRKLVVSLVPPRYAGWDSDESVDMFRPDHVDAGVYARALEEYKRSHDSNASSQAISFFGVDFYQGCNPFAIFQEFRLLNPGQKSAVRRVLCSEDYALILGVPGSGKSSVVAVSIRALVAKGRRVLISSHTNAAVDNLLTKIAAAGVGSSVAGRVGNSSSVNAECKKFLMDADGDQDIDALKAKFGSLRIVAATVSTISSHALFTSERLFDWVFVDEAGQVNVPAILGPLLVSNKFCLIGDHYQLPPLVKSIEAQTRGMDVSLFKTLAENHPQSVVALTCQYRMNADIMSISSALIYDCKLSCANSQVANQRLQLNALDFRLLAGVPSSSNWLIDALSPSNPVVFLNTDSLYASKVNT